MDCKRFRKYVGAFADGELEVAQNLDALEHLNMCPSCARRVMSVTELKAALKRTWPHRPAPERLVARIQTVLDAQCTSSPRQAAPARATQPRVTFRWAVPVGLAATLLLAALPVWHVSQPRITRGALTVLTGQALNDVRQQHRTCLARGGSHHDPSLPRNLDGVAKCLSHDLHLAVLAPDLTSDGFEFLGADRCGIAGHRGAHILYKSAASSEGLSVFTIERWAMLERAMPTPGSERRVPDGGFLVSDEYTDRVVAWHDDRQTHVLCGAFSTEKLISMAGRMRMADAAENEFFQPSRALLAVLP